MKKIFSVIFAFLLCNNFFLTAQEKVIKHKAKFVETTPGYYENVILKEISKESHLYEPRKYLSVDQSNIKIPSDTSLYLKYWHHSPVSQGNSGTCWAFGSVAMFESEVYRINQKKIKLSEMFIVYCDYIERAKHFVKTRGETYFEEGSEANAGNRMMEIYGILPYEIYSGMLPGQKVHEHSKLIENMKTYLDEVKKTNFWNEEVVVENITKILNSYLGQPPASFVFEGKIYSPKTFLNEYLNLIPNDYYSFMSTASEVFNQKAELIEPDNWWHSKEYYNVSLSDFFSIITDALKGGYTLCICGDVSEPGIDSKTKSCIIPTFDIPAEFIDDYSRQLRLGNQSTTDDHCIEIVGYCFYENKYWFLIKDSGAGAFNTNPMGYRYMNEDYIKLKMMNILVYKYAARNVLDKIIK